MKKKTTQKICCLLLLALLLRLSLVYFQYSGDVRNHLAWADSFLDQALGFYSRSIPGFEAPNYPPLTIYLFSLSRLFYHWFSQLSTFLNQAIGLFPSGLIYLLPTLNMQAAFLKLPAILADLGIGYLIYRLLSLRSSDQKPLLVAGLFLFNPAVIYVSTVWGQIESLPVFFLLLSTYLLFTDNYPQNYYLSHLSFLLAILSKQTALWLLPLYLIIWFKQADLVKLSKGLLLQLVVFIILYLPFTGLSLKAIPQYLSTLQGSSNLISDAAWNLWYFIFKGQRLPDSVSLLTLPVRLWSMMLLSVVYLWSSVKYFKSKQKQHFFTFAFLLSLATFFLQTRVHERHLFPALAFLLLVPSYKKLFKFVSYLSLSAFHFANLYWTLGLPFI